MLPLTFIGELR